MAKYLFEARYNAEGAKGVAREGGTGRRAAVAKMAEGLGGKLETFWDALAKLDSRIAVPPSLPPALPNDKHDYTGITQPRRFTRRTLRQVSERMVPAERLELPTFGLQIVFVPTCSFVNQILAALANLETDVIKAQLRHSQSSDGTLDGRWGRLLLQFVPN
jgi:hypothetical protein